MAVIRATATMHRREMNRTEEKYASQLDLRLRVGEIRWWMYEAWKFRLADKTHYTPDFIVVDNALRIEAHEVKVEWGSTGKPGWQEDARAKIKMAAEIHPVRFVAAVLRHDGSWEFEEFLTQREEPAPLTLELALDRIADTLQCPATLPKIIEHIVRLQNGACHV